MQTGRALLSVVTLGFVNPPPTATATADNDSLIAGKGAKEALGRGKQVFEFLEGAVVFAVSRMWYDLVASYILEFHKQPYCETSFDPENCASEASSSEQWIFAALVIPVAGLIKHLSESTGLVDLGGMCINAVARARH
jgi:hypothetical protein